MTLLLLWQYFRLVPWWRLLSASSFSTMAYKFKLLTSTVPELWIVWGWSWSVVCYSFGWEHAQHCFAISIFFSWRGLFQDTLSSWPKMSSDFSWGSLLTLYIFLFVSNFILTCKDHYPPPLTPHGPVLWLICIQW